MARKVEAFITTYVFVGVSIASLAVSVYSAKQQADQAEDVANYNAKVEEAKARDALQIGAVEAADARKRARAIAATQAEGGAMSGVATDYGTPLGLLVETAGIGEHEALTIMNNAQRQSWGNTQQSKLDKLDARNARSAGRLNMAGSALSGASGVLSSGYQSGLFKPAAKPQ